MASATQFMTLFCGSHRQIFHTGEVWCYLARASTMALFHFSLLCFFCSYLLSFLLYSPLHVLLLFPPSAPHSFPLLLIRVSDLYVDSVPSHPT